jgi:hypothetical protein
VDDDLKYSDCPTTEAAILVAADATAIWPLISDIQLPARFSDEFGGADWLDGADGPVVGARFVGHNAHTAIGQWESTSTISRCEVDRVFEWSVTSLEDPSAVWRYSLEAEGASTRLTMWMQIGPARSALSLAIDAMPDKESKILRRRLSEHRVNMERTLQGIKALAEGAGA